MPPAPSLSVIWYCAIVLPTMDLPSDCMGERIARPEPKPRTPPVRRNATHSLTQAAQREDRDVVGLGHSIGEVLDGGVQVQNQRLRLHGTVAGQIGFQSFLAEELVVLIDSLGNSVRVQQ